MTEPSYTTSPLGDSALIVEFGNVIDEDVNRKVLTSSRALESEHIIGVLDVVPAYSSITIHYDLVAVKRTQPDTSAFDIIKEKVEALLSSPAEIFKDVSRQLRIPVCYAPAYAWDLEEIALQLNLSPQEIINRHTARKYRVFMVGFLPGFAYMGEVDEEIVVPRRKEPRLKIDAGYVGIAGKQTGIYPLVSPGGWQIIGRTPLKLFDKTKEQPVLFLAGDEVEFFSISEDEFDSY